MGGAPARGSHGGHTSTRSRAGTAARAPHTSPAPPSARIVPLPPHQHHPTSTKPFRFGGPTVKDKPLPSAAARRVPSRPVGPRAARGGAGPLPHLSASRSRRPRAPLPRAHGRPRGRGRPAPGPAPGRCRAPRARARPVPIATRWDGAGPAACCRSRTSPLLHQDGGRAVGLVPSLGFAAGRLEVTPGPARKGGGGSASGEREEGAGRAPRPGSFLCLQQDGGSGEKGGGRDVHGAPGPALWSRPLPLAQRGPRAGRAPRTEPGSRSAAPGLRSAGRAGRERTKAMSHVPLPSPAAHRPRLGPRRAEGMRLRARSPSPRLRLAESPALCPPSPRAEVSIPCAPQAEDAPWAAVGEGCGLTCDTAGSVSRLWA